MIKRISLFLAVALLTVSCNTPFAVKTIATSTPAATATFTSQPTATLAPTATPTPTPPPAVRIENGEDALFFGDYEGARKEFQDAQISTSDPEVVSAAMLGVGRSLYLAENYSTAIDTLNALVASNPEQINHLANAYFFLAKSYEAVNLYDEAAKAYGKYLELKPGVLDAYVQELRGDVLMQAGDPSAAASAYESAILAPQEGTTIWTELKLGRALAQMGDFSGAIKKYLEVYEKTDNEYAKAQANYLMGQVYLTMGLPEQANARFLDSVANYPRAYDTYAGLVALVSSGVQVNELNRGMVDYYAGEYGLAIEALTRYIDSSTDLAATAYHYRALSRLAMNDPVQAVEDWDYIIDNFSGDSLWPSAWEEKAYTQWAYLDRYQEAAATLLQYVDLAPDSGMSPEFLFQAARILERNGQLSDAAATWERLIDTYPSAEKSYRGLFLAGVSYYRAQDYDRALTVFQRALVLATEPGEAAAAYLWTGKTQEKRGDAAAARTAWEQAAQRDPTGYYSERANELLQDRGPFTITNPVDLGYNLEQERQQAEEWMRATFPTASGVNLSGPGDLANDPRMQRGWAFWDLGLYDEARTELESLRESVINDPVLTYQLMNTALDLGLYRTAVYASRQVLTLASLDDVSTLKAPVYFNHVRFGLYFKDQIIAASQAENIHPLLLLSVMRQESMYEGFAQSGAGARGLMQIMPATGQEIASSINWPENFTAEDLYRPEVSITLGSRYLARQRDYFGGSMHAALAAYNGGPGNTIIWNELAGGDPDLLLEVIRADETRKYITQIFEFFNLYRLIYERGL